MDVCDYEVVGWFHCSDNSKRGDQDLPAPRAGVDLPRHKFAITNATIRTINKSIKRLQ